MTKTNFTQKQKLVILKSAKRTTVKDAAVVAEVHYTTVYDWRKSCGVASQYSFKAMC